MVPNSNSTFTPSPWRRIFCSLFLVAAAVAAIGAIAFSDAVGQRVDFPGQRVGNNAFHAMPAQKIAQWVMEHTANGHQAEFFVVLADQADLSPAANLPTKTEKGRFVYQTLLERRKLRRVQSCSCCANATSSINLSISLTQFW
jgi:hypothetical protein